MVLLFNKKLYATLIVALIMLNETVHSSNPIMNLISEVMFPTPASKLQYRGWPGSFTDELHPIFKMLYSFANARRAEKDAERATESGRAFVGLNVTRYQFFPAGSLLSNKWSVFVPVMNSTKYRNAFNFDLYGFIPFSMFVPYVLSRKKRSISNQRGPEKEGILNHSVRRKREAKLTFFTRIEETLVNYNIPTRDCLLRAVCEVAESPFMEGILGEFLNVLFRATVHDLNDISQHFLNDEYDDFIRAEIRGHMKGNCHEFYPRCQTSIFDLLPHTKHTVITRR